MKYEIKKTIEYDHWLSMQTAKSRVQIAKRLSSIEESGHFGTIKDVDDGVWELKWKMAGGSTTFIYLALEY